MPKKPRPPELLQPLPKKAIHDWQRGVAKRFLPPDNWKAQELGLLICPPVFPLEVAQVEQDYFRGTPASATALWKRIGGAETDDETQGETENGTLWTDRWKKAVHHVRNAMHGGQLPSHNGIVSRLDAILWAAQHGYPLPPEFVGWAETQPQKGPSPATELEAREPADGKSATDSKNTVANPSPEVTPARPFEGVPCGELRITIKADGLSVKRDADDLRGRGRLLKWADLRTRAGNELPRLLSEFCGGQSSILFNGVSKTTVSNFNAHFHDLTGCSDLLLHVRGVALTTKALFLDPRQPTP